MEVHKSWSEDWYADAPTAEVSHLDASFVVEARRGPTGVSQFFWHPSHSREGILYAWDEQREQYGCFAP
jgi:hypothetical protein